VTSGVRAVGQPAGPGADLSLQGRRVVVTRPLDQARRLRLELERLGASVVELPFIEIDLQPDRLEPYLERLDSYDWALFTSSNGVRALKAALDKRAAGGPAPTALRVGAVGPATATALRGLGWGVDVVPPEHSARGLAAALRGLDLAGARVLLPCAEGGAKELVEELRGKGAGVDAVAAYRTVARRPSRDETSAAMTGSDAITFLSPSAVRSFASAGGKNLVENGMVIACIGSRTAREAEALGLQVDVTANEATAVSLAHSLASHYATGAGESRH